MASLDEELRLDAEENEREAQYIMATLPSELRDKYSHDDLLYMMDAIVDYFFTSGVLEAEGDDEGCVDIDLQAVAEHVCRKAALDGRGPYEPDEVFFVVQADMDFQEQQED